MKNVISENVKKITGFRVSIIDNGDVFTISNKNSDIGSFGAFKNELFASFNISRFDGGSFDVVK